MLEGTFTPLPTHMPAGRMSVPLIVKTVISVGSHFPPRVHSLCIEKGIKIHLGSSQVLILQGSGFQRWTNLASDMYLELICIAGFTIGRYLA